MYDGRLDLIRVANSTAQSMAEALSKGAEKNECIH